LYFWSLCSEFITGNGNLDLPLRRTEELLRSPDYRPPLPPKPRNIVSPSQNRICIPAAGPQRTLFHNTDLVDGGPPKWTNVEPDTEASEKELIRELLYVFQVKRKGKTENPRNLSTQQSRNLSTQQSRNLATQQSRSLAKSEL
jgi:hypothetical protein